MNQKEIAILALRITALYFFILTLAQIIPFLSALPMLFNVRDSGDFGSRAFMLAAIPNLLVYLLAAGGLWRFAPKLAELILPGPAVAPSEQGEISLYQIEVFCISLLGLFILASAVPLLAKMIFSILLPQFDLSYRKIVRSLNPNEVVSLIPYSAIFYLAVKTAIGIWFTFGSAGIL